MKKDELIAQIETDKVTIDVRSPEDGLLAKYTLLQEGEAVSAGGRDSRNTTKASGSARGSRLKGEVSSGEFFRL